MEDLPDVDDEITLPSGVKKRFGDCTAEDVQSLIEQLKAEGMQTLEMGTDSEDEMGYPGTLG